MNRFDDAGKLLLRLTIGILLLMHGLFKLANGIESITALVLAQGWPAWIAFGVFIGEIIAPSLLIIGVLTRAGALVGGRLHSAMPWHVEAQYRLAWSSVSSRPSVPRQYRARRRDFSNENLQARAAVQQTRCQKPDLQGLQTGC